METAAATIAWVGAILLKLGHTYTDLQTWHSNLSLQQGLVYKNAQGIWMFVLAGREIQQASLPKYLSLAHQMYMKKALLTQHLHSKGKTLEEICDFWDIWDSNIPTVLHCCYEAGHTLSSYWSGRTHEQQMLLICQPESICVPRVVDTVTLEKLYALMVSKLFEELHFTFSSNPTDLTEGETHDVGYRGGVVALANEIGAQGPAQLTARLQDVPPGSRPSTPSQWTTLGASLNLHAAAISPEMLAPYHAAIEAQGKHVNIERDGIEQSIINVGQQQANNAGAAAASTVSAADEAGSLDAESDAEELELD